MQPRPVILIRSGIADGDVESVHAALQWFKQLARTTPYACPYASALISKFRLAWSPLSAQWQPQNGFRRDHARRADELPVDPKGTDLRAVIDVIASPDGCGRLVLPALDGVYAHHARWLAPLSESFAAGRYFTLAPEDEAAAADRDSWTWKHVTSSVEVVADEKRFDNPVHRSVLDHGAEAMCIEVPGGDADFTAHSIRRIDVGATLIEQVVGLEYGLIAVNRHEAPVRFNGFKPVGAGEALVVHRDDAMLQHGIARAG